MERENKFIQDFSGFLHSGYLLPDEEISFHPKSFSFNPSTLYSSSTLPLASGIDWVSIHIEIRVENLHFLLPGIELALAKKDEKRKFVFTRAEAFSEHLKRKIP